MRPEDPAHRRMQRIVVARSVLHMVLATTALFVTYSLVPLGAFLSAGPLLRLIAGLIAVVVVLVWQVRRILVSSHPTLQAVEATVLAVAMFVFVFSLVYLAISIGDTESFSEPLDRISAVYFTITVLGTVGFGDIAARTDVARLTVAAQMLLDLTLGVVVIRLLFETARVTRSRKDQEPPPD